QAIVPGARYPVAEHVDVGGAAEQADAGHLLGLAGVGVLDQVVRDGRTGGLRQVDAVVAGPANGVPGDDDAAGAHRLDAAPGGVLDQVVLDQRTVHHPQVDAGSARIGDVAHHVPAHGPVGDADLAVGVHAGAGGDVEDAVVEDGDVVGDATEVLAGTDRGVGHALDREAGHGGAVGMHQDRAS